MILQPALLFDKVALLVCHLIWYDRLLPLSTKKCRQRRKKGVALYETSRKSRNQPEWQQNGFTAIPNFILEAAPRVDSIPTVNALAYLQFIANRYDSSHREHTIPTSDADFADYSGFSPKTAQKIRLALLKAGLILSERAKQACWFIAFCDRAAALNISTERHNISTERHLENEENGENPHHDCVGGVGTESAQGETGVKG